MGNRAKEEDTIIQSIKSEPSSYWMKVRETESLRIFKQAAKRVPAYIDFLKKSKIDANKIRTWSDFQNIPFINKDNYLRNYALKDLCWDGNLVKPLVFTATSGSTGNSVYFVRDSKLDWQYSIILESFLDGFTDKPTLVVICFGMGIWIGGLITYKAFEIVANRRNYPISIITPGINKNEILKTLKNLSPHYENIILVGYPPFLKDVVDALPDAKINLGKNNLRILFAAEAITEELRDYLAQKLKMKNIYEDFINIYGSADIGAMAAETLLSILVKRTALTDKSLIKKIFNQSDKTPTLAQFNPLFINFEEIGKELILTGDNAMPLVRYSIGDHGGVLSYDEMDASFRGAGKDAASLAKNAGISGKINKQPFVYVYERKDLSTTFYGLLIYPEWIKTVFFDDQLCDCLTGKFAMRTVYDEKSDQYIEINIELKKGKNYSVRLEKIVLEKIVQSLVSKSTEFREIYNNLKERALPKIIFWPAEDETFFKPGVKQKWTVK